MQWACSVLKRQNSYEFIHNLKNSNNKQEFTGVYWLRRHHCLLKLLKCLLMKELITVKGRKENQH